MLKARLDLSRLLQQDPLDKDQINQQWRDIRNNRLLHNLVLRLQLRHLQLALDRHPEKDFTAEYKMGLIEGSRRMLEAIDTFFDEIKRQLPSDADVEEQ